MNYKDAFNKVLNQRGMDILRDNFMVHSLLLDYLENSYLDKLLSDAFFELNKEPIHVLIESMSLKDAKEKIKERIVVASPSFTRKQYIQSVEPLLLRLYKDEYTEVKSDSGNKATKVHISKEKKAIAPIRKPIAPKPTISDVTINSKVRHLVIDTDRVKDFKVTDDNNNDVTSLCSFRTSGSALSIGINPNIKLSSLRLVMPEKQYRKVNINYSGNVLSVNVLDLTGLKAKEMNIILKDCSAYINAEAKTLGVKQTKGELSLMGDQYNLLINGGNTQVSVFSTSEKYGTYDIEVDKGNISLEFVKGKTKPRINHLFKKVTEVNGVYSVNKESINLMLKAKRGKIKVR